MFTKKEAAVLMAAIAKSKHTWNVVTDYVDGDHIADGGLGAKEVLELMTMAIAMPQLEADYPEKAEQATPVRILITLNLMKPKEES